MSVKNKKNKFDNISEEALENARKDRERTLAELEKLKDVFDIKVDDSSSLSNAMLLGQSVVKLLEQLTRSNQQLVALAQLKEKQESRSPESSDEPIDLKEVMNSLSDEDHEKYRVEVDEDDAPKKHSN